MKRLSQTPSIRFGAVCATLSLVALAGCSGGKGSEDTQVAVRVNKGEITVHQVQAVLQRQPRLLASAGEAATARVLDVLVDQELAAQAARNSGLERDASVIQTMEGVQRETLARAYQDRIALKVSAPSSEEIDRYYDSRPALFAQRRLFLLQETAVQGSQAQVEQLQQALPLVPNAEGVLKLLKDVGINFSARHVASAAEDLPLAVLDTLSNVEVGQSILFAHGGGARIYTVLHAQKSPIDRRAAAPAISSYLLSERKRQAVEEALRGLRQAAKVEYQGAFASMSPASSPRPAAARP